jgi:hypothetical protein
VVDRPELIVLDLNSSYEERQRESTVTKRHVLVPARMCKKLLDLAGFLYLGERLKKVLRSTIPVTGHR